jgi:PASTA domain-containing protein
MHRRIATIATGASMNTLSREFSSSRRFGLAVLLLAAASSAWGAATVTGINEVSSTRVGRTTYDYVFTINVSNGAQALNSAVATVTATAAATGTTIVQGTVALGNLAAGAAITSTNTFTLQQDRTYAFNPAGLSWVVTGTPVDTVPNVVGLTQSAASSAITGAGLTVGTVSTASSSTVPSGSVISQSPTAGAIATAGSAVNLSVSTGPPPVTVPNVVGLTQAAASSAIKAAGLVVGTVSSASSSTVPSGSVISQSPSAGASATAGSAVTLTVSSGPAGGGIGKQINYQPPPPPDPSTVTAVLPTNANGQPVLLEMQGLQLAIASRPRGPVEGLAVCTRWVAMCVLSSGDPSLDDCAHSAPVCQTSTPWAETQCCPSACFSSYQTQRLAGTSPIDAFKKVYLTGSCYPGIN